MQALKLPTSNKNVFNGCSLRHPLNYNKKLWQCKKHWKISNILNKISKKKNQPNPTLSVVEKETR